MSRPIVTVATCPLPRLESGTRGIRNHEWKPRSRGGWCTDRGTQRHRSCRYGSRFFMIYFLFFYCCRCETGDAIFLAYRTVKVKPYPLAAGRVYSRRRPAACVRAVRAWRHPSVARRTIVIHNIHTEHTRTSNTRGHLSSIRHRGISCADNVNCMIYYRYFFYFFYKTAYIFFFHRQTFVRLVPPRPVVFRSFCDI